MALSTEGLTVELVPQTAWYTNVRSNVSTAEWERCKRFVRARCGSTCEVCDRKVRRIDCHEIWQYNDRAHIQTLVGLIGLCWSCHQVKHLGHAEANGWLDRCLQHLAWVNGWSDETAARYAALSFELWRERSKFQWTLDISWLEREVLA